MVVKAGGDIGFPLPIMKPLVPSGILGPLGLNLGDDDASECVEPLNCGDCGRTPRPL